jgi:hypothetical protein
LLYGDIGKLVIMPHKYLLLYADGASPIPTGLHKFMCHLQGRGKPLPKIRLFRADIICPCNGLQFYANALMQNGLEPTPTKFYDLYAKKDAP